MVRRTHDGGGKGMFTSRVSSQTIARFLCFQASTMIFKKSPVSKIWFNTFNSVVLIDDSQQFGKTSAINENIFENLSKTLLETWHHFLLTKLNI